MTLVALGLNHNTAPIKVREKLAFSGDHLRSALGELIAIPAVNEAAILSTCNRTELYCGMASPDEQTLLNWIADHGNIKEEKFASCLYRHDEVNTIRHMFRVACGLDSMVLGEPQILGQMKMAYQVAAETGTLGRYLGYLFQHTFSTAKKVRTDTAIGNSPISVAFAAVRLAEQIFDDIKKQKALLIGAGETIELTARHLHQHGVGEIIVANRTFSKGHLLASRFDGFAISLAEIPQHLPDADIVVSSTASQWPILGKGRVESAIKSRKHKPIFMLDLAVPRDIEPEVAQLQDVYLYSIDDIRDTIEDNLKARRDAALQAEEIIDAQVQHYLEWTRAQSANTIICDYRSQAEQLRDAALTKALQSLRSGKPAEEIIATLARNLTNKLIHTPTNQIKQAGIDERQELIDAARELFKLENNENK